MRILLVEDDPQLGDGLTIGLRQAGFAVDWLKDGNSADQALQSESFDLVVLDLGLPRLSGMEVLSRARSRGLSVPILILTARDATGDKVSGLDAGADDYLVKPIDLDELTARIRALTRRSAGRAAPLLMHGDLALDPAAHCVTRAGLTVELSSREFSLLQMLLENTGRVLTRSQLEQSLYGWRDEPDSNALEVHIHHLRKKLGSELIRTLRGVGYTIPKVNTAWFSLRRRLLGLLLGGVAAAWLVTMVFSYIDAHHEVDELFDAQLSQAAQTLLALASHDEGEDIEDLGDVAHKYQRRLRFQIWRADGKLLLRSNNAPDSPLTAAEGFSETRQRGDHWRYFSQWNSERSLQVQVSENHEIRDELIGHIAWRLLFPALFGLPLIGLWVWLATRQGLSSLDGIARQIASRAPQQLQPLSPTSAPEEIRTMLEALNGLFRRVDAALEAERRFTADAAHELRTPLAALQTQLQVALRARDDDERDRSLGQLKSGLTRASHLVDQMLQLARLDPESALPDPETVDLGKLAEAVCAELGPQILAKNIDFELHADRSCPVIGQAEWLRIMIRNLVDNAVRYTPAEGRIRIEITGGRNDCQISVTDSGPGIPAVKREAVLRRFHRLNHDDQPGCGLGLAIVARIAELHGARIELADAEPPGLCVSVRCPRENLAL